MERKRIFISYAHDNAEHEKNVSKLAYLLNGHGAEVIFDKFNLKYGADLGAFMEQGLSDADYILIICSDLYTQKANDGCGGVGYEKSIITDTLMRRVENTHLIPIKMNNYKGKMPRFLSSKYYADFDNGDFESNYRKIYQQIWNKTLTDRIESNRIYTRGIAEAVKILSEEQRDEYHSYEMFGDVVFHYTSNSGIYILGAGEFEFKTMWSGCGTNRIYAYKDHVDRIGYKPGIYDYPRLGELFDLDYSSRCWKINAGEVFVLTNSHSYIAFVKVKSVNYDSEIVEFEYRIMDSAE